LRGLIKISLGREGYEVYTAENGEKALEKITELDAAGTKIDVILSDVDMPKMSGLRLAVTDEVQSYRKAGTKVILNTGDMHQHKTEIDKLLTDGIINGALPKPYGVKQLLELLEPKFLIR